MHRHHDVSSAGGGISFKGRLIMAKYKFTGETKQVQGSDGNPVTVKQICATETFGDFMQVKAGEAGGWIQSENTLSHDGNSWVFPDAVVCESALLGDDSIVYGNAMVRGDAILFRNARVGGYALVEGKTLISGEATIQGNAHIFENATVKGKTIVDVDAIVKGSAKITGSAIIRDGAEITSDTEWITIGPIGPDDCSLTFYRNKDNKLSVGCSNLERAMTLKEFAEWVKRMHSMDLYSDEYRYAIRLAQHRIGIYDSDMF